MNNCVTSTLAPFQPGTDEWTRAQVAHLYRSIGYGANPTQISEALNMTPSELVDMLVDAAALIQAPDDPFWSDWTSADYEDNDLYNEHYNETKQSWLSRGLESPFHHKMSIFWHDHFSTEREVYRCNAYMWDYFRLINNSAFGNFRTFVQSMGLTEAMLVYLDGNQNRVGDPNENYARELMELFTMGEGNGYTQQDIAEVAKALTGYVVPMYDCLPKSFDSNRFDDSEKTIFGQTGNFNYDDVHELIFSLRDQETAKYICSKIYSLFIYREVNEDIVSGLAETFINSNWEIVPVLKQLLASEHFFESVFHGSKIKSPLDLFLQMAVPMGWEPDVDLEPNIFQYSDYAMGQMGMYLFDPPNVAGWPGNRFWLNENALAYRWSYSHIILNNYITNSALEKLRQMAITLSDSSNDPNVITSAIIDHVIAIDLNQDLRDVGTQYLKAGIPENYFDDGSWNLNWEEAPEQILNLLKYIVRLPEYQLS